MKCGFFKKDITPPLDCYLSGNITIRKCKGVDDPLNVRCVVFQEDGIAVFLCFDNLGIKQEDANEIRTYVAEQLGCEVKDIFVSATHTHTGPNFYSDSYPKSEYYRTYLKYYAAAAAQGAMEDLKEASFFFARSVLPDITYIRRYRMKDGTCRTNPGRHNPDILEPMSEADETIQLLKIVREGGGDIAVVNFQVHADVHGGSRISADYPAVLCDTLEGALPGVSCYYCYGTAGDLNHVNVNCPEWDANEGPEQALHMGRTIAGKILSMYTKARPVATGPVRTAVKDVILTVNPPTAEQVAAAEQTLLWYKNGERDKLPPKGMEFVTAIIEAEKIKSRANAPAQLPVMVCSASMGGFCITSVPGEGFCEIGRQIRETSSFEAQFVVSLTNGNEGYFPMEDAFTVNGYESRTSFFLPGVGEALQNAAVALTKELSNTYQ